MRDCLKRDIKTSHGVIAITESCGARDDVLFIHGNSTESRVFEKQFDDEASKSFHFIALDLPGHGASQDATEPTRTYSRSGLADACMEVLDALGIRKPIIVGWSLGGHVAIEMIARTQESSGLMAVGAPPVGDDIKAGFRGSLLGSFASQSTLERAEAVAFATAIFGNGVEPFMVEAIERTDRRFRSTLFSAGARGSSSSQREVLSSTDIPTAMVNGADDLVVNLDYVDSVPYGHLWTEQCYRIQHSTHCPFWQQPGEFNDLLRRFLADVAK
ncbi:alpha/beta hydrolase [Rhizobium cauense]|uniref:alpha/beta fold hydrolase n=1 Tax=Rhizobium cauense TaxID=1166683 RepID=UPI001C6F1F6B|nr:alpha/beta hydrolase [Rhizobium cauense]MBW9116980.1 alpha/beta hydrolase [Rhizobium cauense]